MYASQMHDYFASGMGAMHCNQRVCMSVCLFVCVFVAHIPQKPHEQIFHEILRVGPMLPVTVVRSSSDVNAPRSKIATSRQLNHGT